MKIYRRESDNNWVVDSRRYSAAAERITVALWQYMKLVLRGI